MRFLLLPLVALLACAAEPGAPEPGAPEPSSEPAPPPTAQAAPTAPPDSLDLLRWIEEARALDTVEDYDERLARARVLANRLDPATGWKAACGEDDPRGDLALYPLSGGDYVVEIVCFLAAYQANFTLALVTPEAATLLPLPSYAEDGTVQDPAATNFGGLPMDGDPADRQFVIFSKARGPGDCGEWARYEVREDG